LIHKNPASLARKPVSHPVPSAVAGGLPVGVLQPGCCRNIGRRVLAPETPLHLASHEVMCRFLDAHCGDPSTQPQPRGAARAAAVTEMPSSRFTQ